jgi:hypothetical protein
MLGADDVDHLELVERPGNDAVVLPDLESPLDRDGEIGPVAEAEGDEGVRRTSPLLGEGATINQPLSSAARSYERSIHAGARVLGSASRMSLIWTESPSKVTVTIRP